jgi:predicted XRE-type DNA-binding protein
MQMLWLDPRIAQGVLRRLAAYQAKTYDPASDAQPGKILHEMRNGEMAALGEVPFGLYYGSVDATPLFVMLVGLYYERTGDDATLVELWPAVEAALAWMDGDGDADGDGFIEYYRATDLGLANPEREQLKAHLTLQIYRIIKHRQLTQAQAGEIIGVAQPQVSLLMRNRSGNFSVERLMEFLTALGQDVEVTVRPTRKEHGQMSVVLA